MRLDHERWSTPLFLREAHSLPGLVGITGVLVIVLLAMLVGSSMVLLAVPAWLLVHVAWVGPHLRASWTRRGGTRGLHHCTNCGEATLASTCPSCGGRTTR